MRVRNGGVWQMVAAAIAAGVVVVGTPAVALAQSGSQVRWGVRATVSPSWSIPQRVFELDVVQDHAGPNSDVHGSELALGFVRARRLGGDWGVAYVRKNLSDATRIEVDRGPSCVIVGAASQCGDNRDTYTTSGTAVHGVELHGFIPWFTIKRRAQVGVNLGLGAVTAAGGTTTKTSVTHTPNVDPVTRQPTLVRQQTTTELNGKELLEGLGLLTILPVAKLELAVTGVLTRSLKVRASGGINVPGTQRFSVTAVYLF